MDEIDYSQQVQQSTEEKAIAAIRAMAAAMPEGKIAECPNCGEGPTRIVDGKCSQCREQESRMYKTW